MQERVRVRTVLQRAAFFPGSLSQGVAQLLGQFLWRVGEDGAVVLHCAAPQRHLEFKLGHCLVAKEEQNSNYHQHSIYKNKNGIVTDENYTLAVHHINILI